MEGNTYHLTRQQHQKKKKKKRKKKKTYALTFIKTRASCPFVILHYSRYPVFDCFARVSADVADLRSTSEQKELQQTRQHHWTISTGHGCCKTTELTIEFAM